MKNTCQTNGCERIPTATVSYGVKKFGRPWRRIEEGLCDQCFRAARWMVMSDHRNFNFKFDVSGVK